MRSNQEQDRQGTNARRARRHASISVEMLEGRQLLAIWSPWSGIGSTSSPTPDAPSSTPVTAVLETEPRTKNPRVGRVNDRPGGNTKLDWGTIR